MQKGLTISQRIGDKWGISNCLGRIGEVYIEIGNFKSALSYLNKSLEIKSKIGDKQSICNDLTNLGIIYWKLNRLNESILYLKKELTTRQQLGDYGNLCYSISSIAELYEYIGKSDSSKFYYEINLALARKTKNKEYEIESIVKLAKNYLNRDEIDVCGNYLNLSKSLCSDTDALLSSRRDYFEIESLFYEKKGQFKESLKAYKKYILLRDSILNQDKKTAVALKEAKFDFDKRMLEDSLKNKEQQKAKDLQITLQNSEIKTQKIKQNAMLAGIAVLVVFAWLLFSRFKAVSLQRKTENQLLLLEKEQALVEERTRIADEMHDDVGADLSNLLLKIRLNEQLQKSTETVDLGTLKNTTNTIIHKIDEIIWSLNAQRDTLKELVDFIVKYYDNLMREHHLKGTVVLPENLPEQALSAKLRRNIFLCTKEILNNTLKHAQANTVNLNFAYANNQIEIGISDNGKGFDAEKSYSGNGLKNLNKRIENMNGKIEVSSYPGNGTSIKLSIDLG